METVMEAFSLVVLLVVAWTELSAARARTRTAASSSCVGPRATAPAPDLVVSAPSQEASA